MSDETIKILLGYASTNGKEYLVTKYISTISLIWNEAVIDFCHGCYGW